MQASLRLFAAFLCLGAGSALAKGTYVLSINGVNTSPKKAESNKEALTDLILIPKKISVEPGLDLFVDHVHNQSSGFGADLVDVWLQKSSEQALRLSEGFFSVGPLPQELGDAIRRRSELAQQIDERAWGSDVDLRDMIDRSSARMKAGDRVFLIPHSQGNLYANRVFDGIFERPGIPDLWKESVGISSVASAASYVASPFGKYVTSSTDVVIGALNAIRGTLPANITLPISSADFTGHGLQEIYLSNSASKTIISANAVFLGQNVKYPGTFISDLSAAANDSAALADLINDANNLSPTPVEPGKRLYLEGSGLGGAQFVVPGVTGRISATSVNLPTDHPLYVSGAEVWKLTIPANAIVGSSGLIRAIIIIDGIEQSFESPRPVAIEASMFDWEIRRKGYAIAPGESKIIGGFVHSCPNPSNSDVGFVGVVVETMNGQSVEKVGSNSSGFSSQGSSICYEAGGFSQWQNLVASTSMVDDNTWRWQIDYDVYGSRDGVTVVPIPYAYTETWDLDGYIQQKKRSDGQCDYIAYRTSCVTTITTDGYDGSVFNYSSCPLFTYPLETSIRTCKARPDASDYGHLWSTIGRYLMQPHYAGRGVIVSPVQRIQMN